MSDILVPVLLIAAASIEIIYIIFREPRMTALAVPVLVSALAVSLISVMSDIESFNIISVSSILLLITAKVFLRTAQYEKPDYRYLIIFAGVIIIHLK